MKYVTKEALIAARKLIEEGGLHKGNLSSHHGLDYKPAVQSYCIVGAYLSAAEIWGHKSYTEVASEIYNFFNDMCPNGRVVQYNDHPQTTKEDALEVYDKAIACVDTHVIDFDPDKFSYLFKNAEG